MSAWKLAPTTEFLKRWAYVKNGFDPYSSKELRVMLDERKNLWLIRFDGMQDDATRHTMPGDTPLEDVQAMALVIWRLK